MLTDEQAGRRVPPERDRSGRRERDVDGLLVHAALVVGPGHRDRRLAVGLEGEAHDRILADTGGPLETGYRLVAVRHHDVLDEKGRNRLALGRAEEPGVHRVRDDGVDDDEVTAGDVVRNPDSRVADGHQPHPLSETLTWA